MGTVYRLTLSRKGQITLPKALRQALGLGEGDTLLLEVTEKGLTLKPLPRLSVMELFAHLPPAEAQPLEDEEVREVAKKRHSERWNATS